MTVIVGWVGNYMRQSKNFDVALDVCQRYGYRMKVAGPNNTALFISHDDMPDFYRSIDLLLVTSSAEAHPLVVYESLACGTPVFMQRGVGDCYSEQLRGVVYYDRIDPEVIHDWIEWALDILDELGRAGRRHIEESWKWSDWIPSYNEMFWRSTSKKENMRVLITVDTPGWAWDFMAKELSEAMLKTELYDEIDIAYTTKTEPKDIDYPKYDALLNHTWSYYNHISYLLFPNEKNIPCANGPAYCNDWADIFNQVAPKAVSLTSVSKTIASDLKRRFRGRPVYHCSRGVDIEKFKP